jgi:hypothetical protein
VRVTSESVKNENGVGCISVEFPKGFIRDPHMRDVIAMLCGEWAYLAKLSITEVITIAPCATDWWCPTQRRLESLRDEGRRQGFCW